MAVCSSLQGVNPNLKKKMTWAMHSPSLHLSYLPFWLHTLHGAYIPSVITSLIIFIYNFYLNIKHNEVCTEGNEMKHKPSL